MRLDVVVDGFEFSARGRYEEQALKRPFGEFQRSMYRQDLNFLMDMPSAPGSEPNRMSIVCFVSENSKSGRVWRYKSIEGTKTLERINLAPLEDAIKNSERRATFSSASNTWHLGGILGMLRLLDQFYEFDGSPKGEKITEGSESVAVLKVTGSLRKRFLDRYLQALGGLEKKGKYPSDLPSDLEIFVGRNDFFPRRIRYLNRNSEDSAPNNRLAETTYFDVILDGEEIPEFRFATFEKGEYPEGVFMIQDITEEVINMLLPKR